MRRYLSSEQRKVFEVAWGMLPPTVATLLREFIRSVRVVPDLNNHRIRCADGSVLDCSRDDGEEAVGFCGVDRTRSPIRGFLVFTDSLMSSGQDWYIIGTMLHELAHAWDYVEHGYRATLVENDRSEASAWLQAATWVTFSEAKEKLAKPVAMFLVDSACYELWGHRPLFDRLEAARFLRALSRP